MVRTMELIETAFMYADFRNEEIKGALKNLIKVTGADLQEAGFEPSGQGEKAELALEEALNNADVDDENIKAAIERGKEEAAELDEEPT